MRAGILAIESLGVSILITLIGLYLVRRIVGLENLRRNNEVAGVIIGIVGTIYAVVLAFIVVVEWQKYDNPYRGELKMSSAPHSPTG